MIDLKIIRDITKYVEDMRGGEMIQQPPYYTKEGMFMQGIDIQTLKEACMMFNAYVLKSYEVVSATENGYIIYKKKDEVVIEWGVSGVKEELLEEEKEKLISFIKSKAQINSAFNLFLNKKKYNFIKDNINNIFIKEIPYDKEWYCIGIDQESVDEYISYI